MSNRLERVMSGVLTIAACAMAVAFVHREFIRKVAPATAAPAPAAFKYVANWSAIKEKGRVIGRPDSPLQLAVFADFECPFCRRSDSVFRVLKSEVGDDLALIFIHYPLQNHRFAMGAARSAECAATQGRFSEYHNVLFDQQDSLGLKSWTEFAVMAGIRDTSEFRKCTAMSDALTMVESGKALGKALGVHGTPDVMLNGWRFPVPPTHEQLLEAIAALRHGKNPTSADLKRVDTILVKL